MFDDIRPPRRNIQPPVRRAPETIIRPEGSADTNSLPPVMPESSIDAVQKSLETATIALPSMADSSRSRRFARLRNLSRRQKTVFLILALVVTSTTGGLFAMSRMYSTVPPEPKIEPVAQAAPEPPKPVTEASRLTGLEVDPALAKRPVTAVMIENSTDARPQSGLKEAGMIIEAIAEGGITRFMALYQESQPGQIGPVRSVRPYYLDFAMQYQAGIAHVGGSPEALNQIRAMGVRDLDQFANAGAYERKGHRYQPHNMYTSSASLDGVNNARGYTISEFKGLPRKADSASAAPNAKAINLNISSHLYNVRYDYDPASNSYLRTLGGKPHTDEVSGSQLSPKVVVALVMPYSKSGVYSVYGTTGSGKAFVFQDGVATDATWHKSERNSELILHDLAGKPLPLNAGQTWISLVASPDLVTFNP